MAFVDEMLGQVYQMQQFCNQVEQTLQKNEEKARYEIDQSAKRSEAELENNRMQADQTIESQHGVFEARRKDIHDRFDFLSQLIESFNGKKPNKSTQPQTPRQPGKELERLYSLFKKDPLWLRTVNVFTLGFFKKSKAAEFYVMAQEGILWCNQQLAAIQQEEEAFYKTQRGLQEDRDRDSISSRDRFTAAMNAHITDSMTRAKNDVRNGLILSDNTRRLVERINTVSARWGLVRDTWAAYTPSDQIPGELCLGLARIQIRFPSFAVQDLEGTDYAAILSPKGLLLPFCTDIRKNVLILAQPKERDAIYASMRGLIMRIVRSFPPALFEIFYVDPVERGNSLGRLIRLTETEPYGCPICREPAAKREEISALLEELIDEIDRRGKLFAAQGGDIDGYNELHPDEKLKHYFLFINDYPEGISGNEFEHLKIISNTIGIKCGVHVIMSADLKAFYDKNNGFLSEFGQTAVTLTFNGKDFGNAFSCEYNQKTLSANMLDDGKVPDSYIDAAARRAKKNEIDFQLETARTFYFSAFTRDPAVSACDCPRTHVLIEHPDVHQSLITSFTQSIFYGMVSGFEPNAVRLSYIDPVSRGNSLGKLVKLTGADPYRCPLCDAPACSKSEITDRLRVLTEEVTKRSSLLAEFGSDASIEEYNRNKPEPQRLPYRFVFMVDFPEGLDYGVYDYLRILTSELAARCGVRMIVFCDRDALAKEEKLNAAVRVLYNEMKENVVFIREYRGRYICKNAGEYAVVELDAPCEISSEKISEILDTFTDLQQIDNSAARFLEPNAPVVFKDASRPLRIPFAVDPKTNETVELEIGGTTTNFAMLTGATGSGKSTTLHTIITELMLNYHPDELEIWLADYKMTEFGVYRAQDAPHLKVIGIENSADFTYGLLDKLEEEFESRLRLFKDLTTPDRKIDSISDYMKLQRAGGKAPDGSPLKKLPRVVLIIDEMSVFAKHLAQNEEYKLKFDYFVREYRAPGLCGVFADQYPIANNRGITDEAQGNIMTRLAMAHDLQNMKLTLNAPLEQYSDELLTAMGSMSTGDVVYKYQEKDDRVASTTTIIRKLRCAYFRETDIKQTIERVKRTLETQGFIKKELLVVQNTDRVPRADERTLREYEAAFPLEDYDDVPLYLGTPTSFEKCFRIVLAQKKANNVLLVSPKRDLNISVVENAVLSFSENGMNRATVFAHPRDKFYRANKERLRSLGTQRGNVEIVTSSDEARERLCELYERIEDKNDEEKRMAVFIGLDEWLDDFADETSATASAASPSPDKTTVAANEMAGENAAKKVQSLMEKADETDGFGALPKDFLQDLDMNDVFTKVESSGTKSGSQPKPAAASVPSSAVILERLIQVGPKYNVFSLFVFESALDFVQTKYNISFFKHRILGTIAKTDCYTFSVSYDFIQELADSRIVDRHLLYTDGVSLPCRFRPYL